MKKLMCFLFAVLSFQLAHAVAMGPALPETFNYEGQLTDTSNNPILDSAAVFNIKIYDPGITCILYEEQQFVDLSTTNGHFSLNIGSAPGSTKRMVSDRNLPMIEVFSNAPVSRCDSVYMPMPGDNRMLVLTVTAGATSTPRI